MKKILLFLLLCTSSIYAQVGIGTDAPNPSTQLEIKSANRGVLIPQVPLTGKTDQTTINAGNLESLLVYNTNTNETLTPGYYYWFEGSWNKLLIDTDLPDHIVFWDIENNQFYYIDENGDTVTINIADLETLTLLGLNDDGHTLEYTDEDGVVTSIDLETIIDNFETLTTIADNGDGTFSYTDENGNTTTIDVSNLETLTSLALNPDGKTLEYIDENGDLTSIDLETIIANYETVTTLIDNGDGTYIFTNEAGETTLVDVVGEVITNIQNQGDIYNEIVSIVIANSDIFVDNGDGTFTHTTVDGDVVTFDANTTTMVNNGDGTYVFTNANGDSVTVDVIGDVVTNIQNQGDIYNEIVSIVIANSDIFVDNGDGTFTHTTVDGDVVTFDANTTTMANNGDGTYVFTNANGDSVTVDVIGDVVTNIQNQGDIYNEIVSIVIANSDIFVDNGDGTFTHTTVDGDVVTFDANTTTMVNNGDGTYVFTNANGDSVTVDVIGDVVTNIQNQGDIYNEIITMLEGQYGNVVYNPTTNTFYYIDENGDQQEIDWSDLNTVNTSFTLEGDQLIITDSNGDTVELAVEEIANNSTFITTITSNQEFIDEIINLIDLNETVTNIVDNGDGTITYTNEDNVSVTIDLTEGPQGPAGEDGKSAYEIAVENGFVGTVAEWLESLIGADGQDGADGADGSVITIENGNWYIDGVDTGVQAGGQNGEDGATPEIGTNGNWWIDGVDTGVKAQGEDGKSAFDIAVDNGFVGTETEWLASLQGADGAAGQDGADGTDGKSAYQEWLDAGNTGSEQDFLDSLIGADGADGSVITIENGNWYIDGIDTGVQAGGQNGEDGATPEIGTNGNWWIDGVDTGVKAQG
ncbi:hypothetical protein, partial [Aequorivita marina]|uniref:hypothetical protein n=1 Tax=Aequorivita marina TaxID=3073654 RepID=UPI002874FC7F